MLFINLLTSAFVSTHLRLESHITHSLLVIKDIHMDSSTFMGKNGKDEICILHYYYNNSKNRVLEKSLEGIDSC